MVLYIWYMSRGLWAGNEAIAIEAKTLAEARAKAEKWFEEKRFEYESDELPEHMKELKECVLNEEPTETEVSGIWNWYEGVE